MKRNAGWRAAALCAVISIAVGAFSYRLITTSGLIQGYDEAVDARAAQEKSRAERANTIEGEFFDRNENAITIAEKPGVPAVLVYDEAYSYLIGYNSKEYGTSGLRKTLYEKIFNGGADHKGASVMLTTDNELQELCYNELDFEGSICVLNAATGEILACASRSDDEIGYNVNDIDNMYSTYEELPSFFWNRAIMAEDPPGSTFKIIMSAALIENGMADYTTDDNGGEYLKIHNNLDKVYGENINLEKALNSSINIYFAKAGVEKLGAAKVNKMASSFMLGKDIETDFCKLTSNFDLGNMSDKALLAQTSFGQGKTVVSPLQLTMVMGAVLNDGKMMTPYLIRKMSDNGRTIYEAKQKIISEAISAKVANELKEYLHSNAVYYGLDENSYGICYAKTGTADMSNGKNHIYFLSGLETNGEKYVIIVDQRNTMEQSGRLKSKAMSVISYLNTRGY